MASDTEESANKVTVYLLFTIYSFVSFKGVSIRADSFCLCQLPTHRRDSFHLRQLSHVSASVIDKKDAYMLYVFIINAGVCLRSTCRMHSDHHSYCCGF